MGQHPIANVMESEGTDIAWKTARGISRVPYEGLHGGRWERSEMRSDIMDELLARLDWKNDGGVLESANMRVDTSLLEETEE